MISERPQNGANSQPASGRHAASAADTKAEPEAPALGLNGQSTELGDCKTSNGIESKQNQHHQATAACSATIKTTPVAKFKEKRPEPLKLNQPLDLSVKSAGAKHGFGTIFNLNPSSLLTSLAHSQPAGCIQQPGPPHLFGSGHSGGGDTGLLASAALETPRIVWQDNEALLGKPRFYSSSGSSALLASQQRLRLSSVAGESPPITPGTPFRELICSPAGASINQAAFTATTLAMFQENNNRAGSIVAPSNNNGGGGSLQASPTALQAMVSSHYHSQQLQQQVANNNNRQQMLEDAKLMGAKLFFSPTAAGYVPRRSYSSESLTANGLHHHVESLFSPDSTTACLLSGKLSARQLHNGHANKVSPLSIESLSRCEPAPSRFLYPNEQHNKPFTAGAEQTGAKATSPTNGGLQAQPVGSPSNESLLKNIHLHSPTSEPAAGGQCQAQQDMSAKQVSPQLLLGTAKRPKQQQQFDLLRLAASTSLNTPTVIVSPNGTSDGKNPASLCRLLQSPGMSPMSLLELQSPLFQFPPLATPSSRLQNNHQQQQEAISSSSSYNPMSCSADSPVARPPEIPPPPPPSDQTTAKPSPATGCLNQLIMSAHEKQSHLVCSSSEPQMAAGSSYRQAQLEDDTSRVDMELGDDTDIGAHGGQCWPQAGCQMRSASAVPSILISSAGSGLQVASVAHQTARLIKREPADSGQTQTTTTVAAGLSVAATGERRERLESSSAPPDFGQGHLDSGQSQWQSQWQLHQQHQQLPSQQTTTTPLGQAYSQSELTDQQPAYKSSAGLRQCQCPAGGQCGEQALGCPINRTPKAHSARQQQGHVFSKPVAVALAGHQNDFAASKYVHQQHQQQQHHHQSQVHLACPAAALGQQLSIATPAGRSQSCGRVAEPGAGQAPASFHYGAPVSVSGSSCWPQSHQHHQPPPQPQPQQQSSWTSKVAEAQFAGCYSSHNQSYSCQQQQQLSQLQPSNSGRANGACSLGHQRASSADCWRPYVLGGGAAAALNSNASSDSSCNNNNNAGQQSTCFSASRSIELLAFRSSSAAAAANFKAISSPSCPGAASRKYHCDQCTKSFTRSDMLTRHRRLHSGDRPFVCSECKQEFSRSDHLSTHMRTHTGEKPYKCKSCHYSACRKDMITRHMKVHNQRNLLH